MRLNTEELVTSNSLPRAEVSRLVYSYDEPSVTDELYTFGSLLLAEIQQRSAQIDAKAGAVLAWATGILAFLFASLAKGSDHRMFYFALPGALFAMLTVICAFLALRTRAAWASPSDKSWFRESALLASDELKRYHLRVMHDVRRIHLELTEHKGELLVRSEVFLVAAAAALFIAMVIRLFLPM